MRRSLLLSLTFAVPAFAQSTSEIADLPHVIGPTYRFADFDGDLLDDVYLVDPSGADWLFRNRGDGAFEDVTAANGLAGITGSRMAVWLDFDNDGAVDLYVASSQGQSKLFQNTGQGLFVDVTSVSGIAHEGPEWFVETLDYDGDALLDLHVVTERGDVLFHNLGRGRFERADLPSTDGLVTDLALPLDAQFDSDAEADVDATLLDAEGNPLLRRRSSRGRTNRAFQAWLATAAPTSTSTTTLPSSGGGPSALIACRPGIQDIATMGCVDVSSTPTLGTLYPLSVNFNVSSGGNVGIGTTTPSSKLGVAGAVRVDNSGANSGTTANALLFGAGASGEGLGSKRTAGGNQNGLDFYASSAARLQIASNGFVGVGRYTRLNPQEMFGIYSPLTSDFGGMYVDTASGGLPFYGYSILGVVKGGTYIDGATSTFRVRMNITDRVCVTDPGLVGIGTMAPESYLHVAPSSAGAVTTPGSSMLTLENNGQAYMTLLTPDASERGIYFGEPSNNTAGGIIYNSASVLDGLAFRTNGNVTRMAVTSTGNVGIGTTAPGHSLHLASTQQTPVKVTSSNTGGTWLELENTSTNADQWHVISTGSGNGEGPGKLLVRDNTTGVVATTFDTNGNVGIGTTAPEARVHAFANSAGAVTANGFSTIVAENNAPCFVSLLTPDASERGILFGEPSHNAAGGILYNNVANPDGLQLRTNGNVTRMAITGAGDVGIGTTSPGEKLELSSQDATVRVRNTNDTGGGFVGDSFSTLQLGLYNPSAAAWGSIPATTKRSLFGMDNTGRVGSLTNNFLAPAFRNVLDDGTGRGSFAAKVSIVNTTGDDCGLTSNMTAGGANIVDGVRASTDGKDSFAGLLQNSYSGTDTIFANGLQVENASSTSYGIFCVGQFAATGTKAFVQPHPDDPSKELQFACLEGNENGTYFRGSSHLAGGRMVIDVPEEFRLVSESKGLTVQVTAVGLPALVWVESKDLDHIVVRGNIDADFDYTVNGVRRGYAEFNPIRENAHYVPFVRGVPFGTQYPDALRDVLVQSGVLNADYTPNEATAVRMGWTLVDAESPEAAFGRSIPRASTNSGR